MNNELADVVHRHRLTVPDHCGLSGLEPTVGPFQYEMAQNLEKGHVLLVVRSPRNQQGNSHSSYCQTETPATPERNACVPCLARLLTNNESRLNCLIPSKPLAHFVGEQVLFVDGRAEDRTEVGDESIRVVVKLLSGRREREQQVTVRHAVSR